MMRMRIAPFVPVLAAVAAVVAAMAVPARAATSSDAASAATPAISPHHHLDPGLPPLAARQAAATERRAVQQTRAPSLESQVEARLRASFDAADTAHAGTLTRAQAQAGGFGFIAQHFDAIDTRHAGAVSFDDLRRYLQLHDARYVAK